MSEILSNAILCIHAGEHRAALVLHWGAWLPAELNPIYAAAIRALRAQERRLTQITNFQSDGSDLAVRRLFRAVLAAAVRHEATDIVAVVNPDDARGYCDVLSFEDLLPDEPPREWDLARDVLGKLLPTRLIRLALDEIPPERMERL